MLLLLVVLLPPQVSVNVAAATDLPTVLLCLHAGFAFSELEDAQEDHDMQQPFAAPDDAADAGARQYCCCYCTVCGVRTFHAPRHSRKL